MQLNMPKENGYDAFSTTLLVSPYQKHELIIQMAEEAGKEFDIPFTMRVFAKVISVVLI